ncbi:MAG: DoxX family protein [Gammaproteobacteria bacterium]|nr:MAG: DoxX family protein [Gammaproteobacteria bacterium]
MTGFLNCMQGLLDRTRALDFLGPLALRIYLAPIFIMAGSNKLAHAEYLGPYFESLGIPAPQLMVYVAGLTELVGGFALLAGLAVRWMAAPLMFTMIIAATTAHWENGWHALPETELTMPWEWRTDLIEEGTTRKEKAREILREHGNYGWLTEAGSITILKNGIEFAATYFIMLLALFFTGAGKYLSFDYWIARKWRQEATC